MKKIILKLIKDFFSSGIFIPIIVLAVIASMSLLNKADVFEEGEKKIVTKSNLLEAIDVSELATSEFIYNGIAMVYNDEEEENVKYYIRYDARVKAGIDIQEVDFDIQEEEKIICVILPSVKIFSDPSIDLDSLSYIPSDEEYDLGKVLKTCEEDVMTEVEAATELRASAEDNLKGIIKTLITPLAEAEGYQIEWGE